MAVIEAQRASAELPQLWWADFVVLLVDKLLLNVALTVGSGWKT